MLSSPVVEWTVADDARAAACWYGDAEPLVALLAGRYQPLTNLGSSHLQKTVGGEQNRKKITQHVILLTLVIAAA
jgi:hypothetical protein